MTAPEIYKSIATDGLTDSNRSAFESLPNAERLGLWKALKQDFPDVAEQLKQGLPEEAVTDVTEVAAAKVDATTEPLPVEPPAHLTGKIPSDFPGAAELAANEPPITTFSQLRREVKQYQHLTHIHGIGDSTDAKILKALEE